MGSLREDLGNRIRELRLAKGLSQPALASRIDMDFKYLGGVERGERNVTVDNLERILKALDVSPSELWSTDSKNSADLAALLAQAKKLDRESRRLLSQLARHFLSLGATRKG